MTLFWWHLKSEPCIVSCLVYQLYQKFLYAKAVLFTLCISSRATLKLFIFVKNDDGGVPLWHRGLRNQHCHCSGSCCCGGMGSVPGPRNFQLQQVWPKQNKKQKTKWWWWWHFWCLQLCEVPKIHDDNFAGDNNNHISSWFQCWCFNDDEAIGVMILEVLLT